MEALLTWSALRLQRRHVRAVALQRRNSVAGAPGQPDGTERLYVDGVFNTYPHVCETYGNDLTTGAAFSAEEYRAKQPRGRAFLHAVDYAPPPEEPDADYPLRLTTGRTVYHFHTRTKTGRAPELQAAAPKSGSSCVRMTPARLASPMATSWRFALDEVRSGLPLASPTSGRASSSSRSTTATGTTEDPGPRRRDARAANELTLTSWDPVSKQPMFKVAAVSISRISDEDAR